MYWRMGATGAATTVGLVLLLGAVTPAQQAQAHGAPWNPISRGAACAPDNDRYGDSPACQAAQVASAGTAMDAWDNMRRKDVKGNHRSVVPDGELCSAGLDQYRGLNLPRTDWPATIVNVGAELRFSFLATIPYKGKFELYLTKEGYDPTKPLRWSDLASRPFAVVSDPPLWDSAYQFDARLPEGRTGRHVIFTIWENTELPDTYYFCSDVVFRSGSIIRPQPTPSADRPASAEATPRTRDVTLPKSTIITSAPVAPAATALAGADQSTLPVAEAADILPGSFRGRLTILLAGTLAAVASGAVLVLTFTIRRQSRRRS
ncbi:lytic polysaccharide monooxygenase [Streptomyces sp. NPDC056632]|uniref:lytic polysaccharide monooxygenase auxiliary activity family 9 protein n=1 Tax=Streptomyces sp. NPDC056632 TaxID=3345884 RepID=UPI0036C60D0E